MNTRGAGAGAAPGPGDATTAADNVASGDDPVTILPPRGLLAPRCHNVADHQPAHHRVTLMSPLGHPGRSEQTPAQQLSLGSAPGDSRRGRDQQPQLITSSTVDDWRGTSRGTK